MIKKKATKLASKFISVILDHRGVALLLIGLALLSLLAWKLGGNDLGQFGLNAFTETIGIGVTVFLVDQLLKDQDRRRRRPLEAAAFNDVRQFVGGLGAAWQTIYNWSGKDVMPPPPPLPPTVPEFFTMNYFNLIRTRLDLNAAACIFPKRTWWDYLPQVEKQYRDLGEKILDRHSAILEPSVYRLVHKVVNGFLDPNVGLAMLPVLRNTNGFVGDEMCEQIPDNEKYRLGNYWTVREEDLNDFSDLYRWYHVHCDDFIDQ